MDIIDELRTEGVPHYAEFYKIVERDSCSD
jgi:hypothetical protein